MRCRAFRPLLLVAALVLGAGPAAAQQARAQEAPAPGDVVINEILYDPPPEADAGEYVELFNRSGRAFDLSEFSIADSRDVPVPVTATPQMLAPGAYAVLVQDGEAFAAVFPDVASEAAVVEPGSWPQLNNSGDRPQVLYDGSDERSVIDAVPYEPSWGGQDVALERIDPAGPSDDAGNFGNSTAAVGTPGAQNTLAGGDATPPVLQSVTVVAERTTLTAVFSEALDPASVQASAFSLEAEEGRAPAVTRASPAGGDAARVELALAAPLAPGAYTLTARGVRDAAGNELEEGRVAFAVAPGRVPAAGDVVVNELWYAPEEPALEFVELYNRSGEGFDLSRFLLADERRDGTVIATETTLLRPQEYTVLVRDSAAFAAHFPGVPFVEVSPWSALNNGGDTSVLSFETAAGEKEIDAVPYEPSWGGTRSASLERRDPAGPSARAVNFGTSTAPKGATPGAQNSVFARDTEAPRPVFAREVLGNENTFAVDFSEPLAPATVQAADFAISARQPSSVEVGEDGRRVLLYFERAPGGAALTARGVADLTGNVLGERAIEIAFVAEPFAERPPGDLVVNEILYDPLDDDFDDRPNQPEYVELYNATDRRLALEGYFFTDRPDENGASDSLAIGRPQASVPPGGFAVAYAAEGGELEGAFPEIDFADATVTLLPVERSTLGLLNGGDLVALRRPDGALLDSVFYRPAWQSRAVASGDGRALERIDPLGPSSRAANWTTATAESGGTPGRPNRAAPPPGGPPAATGVEITPSPFSPDGDGIDDVAFIRYTLGGAVSLVRVRIYDTMGREVYEREAALAGRTGQLPWKGRSDAGEKLRVGIYVVLFEALDADGGAVEAFKEPVVLARPLE